MANATLPGGVMGKGNAQEEVIAYRGDLQFILAAVKAKETKMQRLSQDNFIPLEGGVFLTASIWRNFSTIGSPLAYDYRPRIEEIDVFAAAALRHSSRMPGKQADVQKWRCLEDEEKYWDVTGNKIRTMLHFAAVKGYDSLVLGAFGNGAFANPVKETIAVFKKVLKEYDGHFKEIRFAVLTPPRNTHLYNEYHRELDGFDRSL